MGGGGGAGGHDWAGGGAPRNGTIGEANTGGFSSFAIQWGECMCGCAGVLLAGGASRQVRCGRQGGRAGLLAHTDKADTPRWQLGYSILQTDKGWRWRLAPQHQAGSLERLRVGILAGSWGSPKGSKWATKTARTWCYARCNGGGCQGGWYMAARQLLGRTSPPSAWRRRGQ